MPDQILERNYDNIEKLIEYANEAGETLRHFSEQVTDESKRLFDVFCRMSEDIDIGE
ncbi:hypothetical protein [Desulfosarcina ovata]|uniref:Uncharacterized protein n=1 Tax=Desulfosarcina ovata subsp. ovata TaxID=2752305 RepID=A0A5K8AB91_9BACT|nr:hypothetical protein [Desulfosarcina ovata]BBO89912.1 hypothetical protein DSCOOX_30920 [Desulfosarcina ovata subsp. ovata]